MKIVFIAILNESKDILSVHYMSDSIHNGPYKINA